MPKKLPLDDEGNVVQQVDKVNKRLRSMHGCTVKPVCPRVPKDALECMVASNPSVLGFGLLNQAPDLVVTNWH